MKRAVVMEKNDNVATCVTLIDKDELVEIFSKDNVLIDTIKSNDIILSGNKISLKDIKKGEHVYKYGYKIGLVIEDIEKGDLVYLSNLDSIYSPIPKSVKESVMCEYNKRIEK